MKTKNWNNHQSSRDRLNTRRAFLKMSAATCVISGISGSYFLTGCKKQAEEEVTPAEDLMREHGVLRRILLVYDTLRNKLFNNEQFQSEILNNSAVLIRDFIENYHEKLEEDFIFPRFEKAGQLVELVGVLRLQHQVGRTLTNTLIQGFNNVKPGTQEENQKLAGIIYSFNNMYRPHAAREDTVLFPALKTLVPEKEYDDLGEDFENKEHELFGEAGFEGVVVKVSEIEKKLGIYDLSSFTPESVI